MKVQNRRNECKDNIYIYKLVTDKGPPEDRENEMIAYRNVKVKIGIFLGGYKEVVRVCLV